MCDLRVLACLAPSAALRELVETDAGEEHEKEQDDAARRRRGGIPKPSV